MNYCNKNKPRLYLAFMNKMTYYFTDIDKPVVLLLHGFLGSKAQWSSILQALENQYSILMVELPGHGNAPSVDDYSISNLTTEISQYLHKQAIKKVHFVGHSMGGYVGAAFAKTYPQQLLSLTMINSIANADGPARKQMRNRAIQLIDRFQNAYVSMAINNLFTAQEQEMQAVIIQQMKNTAQNMSIESVLAALRAMRDRPAQDLSNEIVLQYIYGNRDTVIDKSLIIKEIAKFKCTGTDLNGGHMLLLTHPVALLQNMHFMEI